MNHFNKESTQNQSKPSKSNSSDSFQYDPDIEPYIGKRTGLLFRRVNPKVNFDGFPRFSQFESYGEHTSASELRASEIEQHNIQNNNNSNPSDRMEKMEKKGVETQKVNIMVNNNEDSFQYKPSECEDCERQNIQQNVEIRVSNTSSSRIPDGNIPSFSNISTIKRNINNTGRRSQINTYAKLFDAMKEQNLDQFILNQELLNDISTSSNKIALHEQQKQIKVHQPHQRQQKKKKTNHRVSFNNQPIQIQYTAVQTSKELMPDNGSKNIQQKCQSDQATNNFLRKLEESHERSMREQGKVKEEGRYKQKKIEQQQIKQQQRKSKLMKAFRLTQIEKDYNNSEKDDKFSHKKTSYEHQEHKQQRKRNNQSKKNMQEYDYQVYQGRKNIYQQSRQRSFNNSFENERKIKPQKNNKIETKRQPKKNNNQRKRTAGKSENKRNKHNHEQKNKRDKKQDQSSSYGAQSSRSQEVEKGKKKKRRQKKTDEKQGEKITKIRGVDKNEYIKKIVGENDDSETGRYPKRCRIKPTKYWQSERVHYKEGKVVGIANAQVNFLRLIGADSNFETSININFQNNNLEAEILLPGLKNIYCRGFTDPYKQLIVSLSAKDLKSSVIKKDMITLDDGIQVSDLSKKQKVNVEADRVFTIENQCRKQVTLLMNLNC